MDRAPETGVRSLCGKTDGFATTVDYQRGGHVNDNKDTKDQVQFGLAMRRADQVAEQARAIEAMTMRRPGNTFSFMCRAQTRLFR